MGIRTRGLWPATFLGAILLSLCGSALASGWSAALHTGSSGEARAQLKPSAPTDPAATCTSSTKKTVKVSWAAVPDASTYTVYQSTTSGTGGYAVAASGVTTISWTTGTLASGDEWFEVAAVVGANWESANSSGTVETTITSNGCRQP